LATPAAAAPARVRHEFLPTGVSRVSAVATSSLTTATSSLAVTPGFDYDVTSVGTVGKITVYYATSLGTPGRTQAQQMLARVAAPFADMEKIFGVKGGNVKLVVSPLSAANDGGGGAYHYGCDFSSGGVIYADATYANNTVDPTALEVGLYVAELSESFMGAQGLGWDCGGSNGEGLSRYLAEYEMAPNKLPSWGFTVPSWASAGFPDWIGTTEATDRNYTSIGAAVAYTDWATMQGFPIAAVARAGGATLSDNWQAITGSTSAYTYLTAALSGITIRNTDNPWFVNAEVGVRKVKADFNGDGIEDLLIVNAAGTFEYLGKAAGGFTADAWVRRDLPLNLVHYYPGDFNGDGRTDLIIQNTSGAYEYLGNAAGGFTANVWVRHDLPLGKASFVPGDFNGDGKDDLMIVTSGGSFEYTGLAAGGFTGDVWYRTNLVLSYVGYTVGDFNGDGRKDFILQTASGSFEYTGLAAGGFTSNVWVRNDLPLTTTGYTVGDFNGDGRSDLIIQNATGAYEYTGLAAGGFTADVWVRHDLPLGFARLVPGDYNGDLRSDLMVVIGDGSFEYTGLTAGGFTGDVWYRTDLPSSIVDYTSRDLNGDGKSDLIIQTRDGSYEYTGRAGGGFTGDVWVRNDLPMHENFFF